jgi:HEAT repeat protein
VLAREFPKHPATREALLAAREDPDAEVRLRAALELGDEGRDVLLALASGEGAEDATTARAVAALGARLDPGEARKLLGRALRTRRIATAQACIEVLGRQRGPDAVTMLARVLAVEKGDLAVAAADALGTTHDAGAEAPLVRVLDSPSGALREAAARALGRAGTATAVPPLKAAESRHYDLARPARQAIAEIQARLAGAEPGQLSLAAAEGEVGRLSLADTDPAGRLTLAGTGTGDSAAAKGTRVAPEPPAPEGTATPAETLGTPESATAHGPRRPPAARSRARE